MTCMAATGGLVSIPAALATGADVSHVTGAFKQSAPMAHVAPHCVSGGEASCCLCRRSGGAHPPPVQPLTASCSGCKGAAAACAGDLLLQTHSLHGLTLRPALAAEELLLPVMNEFAFNLESFNPAFTATLLKVKRCRCTSV